MTRNRGLVLGIVALLLAAGLIVAVALLRDDSDGGSASPGGTTTSARTVRFDSPEDRALSKAVPETSCRSTDLRRDAEAAVLCYPKSSPAVRVEYQQFRTVQGMYELYYDLADVRGKNRNPSTKRCPVTEAFWAGGAMFCLLTDDSKNGHVVWTDDKRKLLAILGYASGSDDDVNPLLDYWVDHRAEA